MKSQRLFVALTIINVVILLAGLASMRVARAQESAAVAPVLRGRALEIVDESPVRAARARHI